MTCWADSLLKYPEIMAGDSRKKFLLTTAANHFATQLKDPGDLYQAEELNNFLDDGNVNILTCSYSDQTKQIKFSNDVSKKKKTLS